MRQLFEQSGADERARIVATLVGEVNALLGLVLGAGEGESDWDGVLEQLGRRRPGR